MIDFNIEELERANVDIRRMSTPKDKNEVREPNNAEDDATDPRVVLSAVHELLERLHQQSWRMKERSESLSDRVECMNTRVHSLEGENTQNVYYHPTTCRERELGTSPHGREKNKTKERLTVPAAEQEETDELSCALDEKRELVSHRRKETPECKPQSGKPLVRPSMFDGKGSWEDGTIKPTTTERL